MEADELTYPVHLRGAALRLSGGEGRDSLGLGTWTITDESLAMGSGPECFREATRRLLGWEAHRFAGVHVTETGADTVSLRFGPTVSPCLILDRVTTPTRTVLVYGTLPGHVESGEEAFIIEMHGDATVTGRCVAFSRPARFWARLGAPLARGVQLWITRRYLRGMRRSA
ncbi:DUF1990 domain-containing protein [Corynebacterium pacaense]|uniref:DUF1990 domain-containing protein n=1 Tax=Corynebacterium pacaense TaxID=1816684 RepID=UPI001FEAD2CA|nr:DUF1990 domain-containing protein [Corynebacterium pacaense]